MSNKPTFISMLEDGNKTPFLKKEAIVPIEIGTGYLQQIASIIPVLLEGKSQDDLNKIEELIQEKKQLEPWMAAIASLQVLIKTVFEKAHDMELVEFKDTEEAMKEEIFKPEN